MSRRMDGAAARSLANPVSLPAAEISERLSGIRAGDSNAKAGTNSGDNAEEISQKPDGRQLVRRVIDDFEMKDSTFAEEAGCAASDLSNAFKKNQRFDLQWLLNQPRDFVCCWITELEEVMGLTPQTRRRVVAKAHFNRAMELLDRVGEP